MSGPILPTRLPPNVQTGRHRALGGLQIGNDMWSHDQAWSQHNLLEQSQRDEVPRYRNLPGPTVDLVFPESTALRVLRALMASQAQMELVNVARPERWVLKAWPVLRGPKGVQGRPG